MMRRGHHPKPLIERMIFGDRIVLQQRGAFEAAEAKVTRLQEESRYLEFLDQSLALRSSVRGLVMTPRLKEKVGSYLPKAN